MLSRGWMLFSLLIRSAFGAEPCDTTPNLSIENKLNAGITVGMYLPTRLPNFQSSEVSYGPTARIPIGMFSLHPTVLYGSGDGITFFIFDVTFRFTLPSPLFPVFVFAGPHFLHYTFAQQPYDYAGGDVGFGLSLTLSEMFILELAAKEYFSVDRATSLGASVLLRL
jgi:hypothetical protein